MNKKKPVVIAFVVVLSFLIIAIQGAVGERHQIAGVPTSYDRGELGLKAYYLLLKELGYNTGRFEESSTKLDELTGEGMIIVKPFEDSLDEGDARRLYDWAASGNRLLIAVDGPSPFWDLLSVKGVTAEKFDSLLRPSEKNRMTRGVEALTIRSHWRFELPPEESHPFRTYLKDEYGVICASTRIGRGEIFILSAPRILENSLIGKESNGVFSANLASAVTGNSILFNEAVHGFVTDGKMFVFSELQRVLIIQAIFGLIVFYLVFLKRFGIVRELKSRQMRESVEYIHSLGGLFRRAGAVDFAAESIWKGYRRKLLKILKAPSDLSDEALLQLVSEHGGFDRSGAAVIKNWVMHMKKKAVKEGDLIELCKAADRTLERIK